VTTFYLIRHGSNDLLPHTLAGRLPGVHLNETGRREAQCVADHLSSSGVQYVFSSPLERCRETATRIAGKLGLDVQVLDELNEVNFGSWAGRTFAELDRMEEWKRWNVFRSGISTPGGETMLDVQARMVGVVHRLHDEMPDGHIALVSHGDPIRSVLMYFLGIPPEFVRRVELGPASVTILTVSQWDAQIQLLNFNCDSVRPPA